MAATASPSEEKDRVEAENTPLSASGDDGIPAENEEKEEEESPADAGAGGDGLDGIVGDDAMVKDDTDGEEQKTTQDASNSAGQNLDLSKLTSKYNPRLRSTLQPVLVEYGLPPSENVPIPKKKKKESPPKKLQRETTSESSLSEGEVDRTKQKQEYYRQVYFDIHRLRDLFYEEYTDALRYKIKQQRDEIRKRDIQMMNKLKHQEQKDLQDKQNVRKRFQRHQLTHDDSYLKGLPKTQYYKIVALHDSLRKQGKLHTQTEVDRFWTNIKRPEVYQQFFPPSAPASTSQSRASQADGMSTSVGNVNTRSRTSSSSSPTPHAPMPAIAHMEYIRGQLGQITEVKEPTRPSTGEGWAVTQQAQYQHKMRSSAKSRRHDPIAVAKQAAVELDKLLPPMELPKLHCFTDLDLGEKPVDPEEILRQTELQQRERDRRIHVKKLRQMYHLAMSNTASAQRIIDQHQDELGLQEPTVAELTSAFDLMPIDSGDESSTDERPWEKYLTRAILPVMEVSEENMTDDSTFRQEEGTYKMLTQPSAASSTKRRSRRSSMKSTPSTPNPIPVHLTMSSVVENAKIMEAKKLSSLWRNYCLEQTSQEA